MAKTVTEYIEQHAARLVEEALRERLADARFDLLGQLPQWLDVSDLTCRGCGQRAGKLRLWVHPSFGTASYIPACSEECFLKGMEGLAFG